MSKSDGFGHELPYKGKTNDWITPKWIIQAFNNLKTGDAHFPTASTEAVGSSKVGNMYFDLDPCASMTQPHPCAANQYTIVENGLLQRWVGMVYCNPPYGRHVGAWVKRMAEHGEGIMLIFARVETEVWQSEIFPTADGFLFPRRRVNFLKSDGTESKSSAGAPSAFVAWGNQAREALITLCDNGALEGAFLDRAFYTNSRLF